MVFIQRLLKDTFIERNTNINYGSDQILELSSDKRILIQLKENEIDNDFNYYLTLILANAENINEYPIIKICPLTEQWIEGLSSKLFPSNNGVNWLNSGYNDWNGGNYDNTNCYIFEWQVSKKLIIPLNNFSNIENGLIIMIENENSFNGNLYFYSNQTHTVFYPLIIKSNKNQVIMDNNISYIKNSKIKIYEIQPQSKRNLCVNNFSFVGRPLFPQINFKNEFNYLNEYFLLPKTTYIELSDYTTNNKIIDFSMNIALDIINNNNSIDIDLSELLPNRYYKMKLKIVMGEKSIYSDDFIFYLKK